MLIIPTTMNNTQSLTSSFQHHNQVLGMGSLQVSPTIRVPKREIVDVYGGGNHVHDGHQYVRAATAEGVPVWSVMVETEEDVEEEEGRNCWKKRRLSAEQVKYLEESFEAEKKLEPERKAAIARRLGLEARQVAVWFQNRRARSKGKTLERDYNALRADYHALFRDHQLLKAEVERLTTQLKEEKDSGKVERKDGNSEEQQSASSPTIDNINDDNIATSHRHVSNNLIIKSDDDDCCLFLWPDLICWQDDPPPFFCH